MNRVLQSAIVIAALLGTVLTGSAQQRIRIVDTDDASVKAARGTELIIDHTTPIEKADTAYYANIMRRYSWIVGRGDSLDLEAAKLLPVYYRFTMKNEKGHWQHIEAMAGDSLIEGAGFSLYFEAVDSTLQFASHTAQLFEYTDSDGTMLFEERSYDSRGQLLCSLQFNPNPDGRIIASYNNRLGFPVDFIENSVYTYGNVVAITYDSSGRECILDFMDGAGYCRQSLDGVYQVRFKYDNQDRVIERTNHNSVGDLMNDSRGVAITNIAYDAVTGQPVCSSLTADRQPVNPTK